MTTYIHYGSDHFYPEFFIPVRNGDWRPKPADGTGLWESRIDTQMLGIPEDQIKELSRNKLSILTTWKCYDIMPMLPLIFCYERFMSMQVTSQRDIIDRITDNIVGAVMPFSKEKERRIIAAALAEALGHGGVTYISERSKLSRNTISKAIPEMKSRFEEIRQTNTASKTDDREDSSSECATNQQESEEESPEQLTLEELIERFYGKQPTVREKDRQRKKGGGRKRSIDLYPDLISTVEQIVSASSYGNPESLITYTSLSLRDIADELSSKHGIQVSRNVVSDILEILGYSKQQNKKLEQVGKDHVDRDAQFKHIEETASKFLKSGEPVISIDCKKKEHLGNHKNNGQEYRKVKDARAVRDHDYIIPELGSVAPYGVYTMNNNTGFVNLGISHDTPEFSVASIRAWWYTTGIHTFPNANTVYICSDGGGSNSVRSHLFKLCLAKLAEETGLVFEISHFPPGTSKWNKIEHRLFSFISKNWAGKPLVDVETVVKLIGSTTTRKGLRVICITDKNHYETGIKVADKDYERINIEWIQIGSSNSWNYRIHGFKTDSEK